ncbi:MAG: E3 ubiquitin-protein ligase [Promethearchaeota archaeon]|nr:MAG: E3 ubiquitin-protein ligase [Candidatus Lokiarchaeota archaeon]
MNTIYEDVFFYIDIVKDGFLKKKDIIKNIQNYISEKKKTNIKGHYGLLIFQQEGNPIFIIDKKDSEIIANAIEENWKTRPKTQSYFENGLFYIFSYIAEKIRKKSKYYRIIIITDTPSDLSEDYTNALFNIVSKIKNFPTFIDIIRLSEDDKRFFKDDVKLNILASDTKGSIFYVKDKKEFSLTLKKLLKMKQPVSIFTDKEDKTKISKEDYKFYSHLAKRLVASPKDVPGIKCSFCDEEICPVCVDVNDIPLKCSNCGTAFHKCCIINYSIEHNIGIPHIFRCPNCEILTQIDQDEIVSPEDPKIESADEYIEEYMQIYNESIESAPDSVSEQVNINLMPENNQKQSQINEGEEKKVRIGGFFGKVYSVKKVGDKIVYQRSLQNQKKIEENYENLEEDKKQVIWKPAERNNGKPKFFICPTCGHQMSEKEQNGRCSSCGMKF